MESHRPRRVFLVGATGTIGRATARALVARGHEVVCFVRASPDGGVERLADLGGAEIRVGDVTDEGSIERDGLRSERFDTVVSCLASRTGPPSDAWAIDQGANLALLNAARTRDIGHFVLLSAICVQKPKLAFQHAKIAFEEALIASGTPCTIVRPTAFFKSLSGQVARVQRGKPWLLFGDGRLTACKPISDGDLAAYLIRCVEDPALQGRVLPIGGPGSAITPREQAEALFALLGKEPRYRQIPVRMMDVIVSVLGVLGRVVPGLRDKAEYARIGRYYATESMLVWDEGAGRYDAEATPETGSETLFEHYAELLRTSR
jgi:divinyl chlorophyllide a 8-vinyl-reductase